MWARVRQVLYYLSPALPQADERWALAQLNGAQQALFQAMSLQDRAHAVRVARRLASPPPHVLEAALLHDCGKPAGYGLVARVVGVLTAGLTRRWPQEPPLSGWRRALQIYRWHDAYGLEAARAAGTSPAALALLEAYQGNEKAADEWLEALVAADDAG